MVEPVLAEMRKGSAFERILRLAGAMDVRVVIGNYDQTPALTHPGWTRGTRGHGCDPRSKVVYVDHVPDEPSDEDDLVEIAAVFHELVHVLCHPAPLDDPKVPSFRNPAIEYTEAAVLLPYEYHLARALFPREMMPGVITFQRVTFIDGDMEVGHWRRHWESDWFRRGTAMAMSIGLLQKSFTCPFKITPTLKRANDLLWPPADILRRHEEEVVDSASRSWSGAKSSR